MKINCKKYLCGFFSSGSGYHIISCYLKRKILWFYFPVHIYARVNLLSFTVLMNLSQYWNLDPFSEKYPLHPDKCVMICLSITEDIGNEILVSPKFPVESHFLWASFLSETSVGTHTYCTLLTFSWIGFKGEEVCDFHFCGILCIHSVYHVSFHYFYADLQQSCLLKLISNLQSDLSAI